MAKHIAMVNRDGGSAFDALPTPQSGALEHAGWSGVAVEASGLFCFEIAAEPGAAEFPMHDSPDAWVGYVVCGGGTLYSGSAAGEKLGEVTVAEGDWITFEPNTQHAWKNGDAQTRMLFIKRA
ncbi:MAG: cupin domain-containing protein [Planctomycetota bacterium]